MNLELKAEALAAIARGVDRGDSVNNLETLGVNPRYVNILERFGICTLGQLVRRRRERLMSFPSLGGIGMGQIFSALARYHELPDDCGLEPEHEARKREVWERSTGKAGVPAGAVQHAEEADDDED